MRPEWFESPDGRAVFWSGEASGFMYQLECSRESHQLGWTSISDTLGANWLDGREHELRPKPGAWEGITERDQAILWNHASRMFAQQATGEVHVLAHDAKVPNKTFATHELPALLENEQVTTINGMPRETLAAIYEAHSQAALKELGLDPLELPRSFEQADLVHEQAAEQVISHLNVEREALARTVEAQQQVAGQQPELQIPPPEMDMG